MTDYTYTGSIETVNITTTGTYAVTAYGAEGGGVTAGGESGGLGAEIGGDIFLQAGAVLEIVVGGEGGTGSYGGGGGGGGSFVIETFDGTNSVDIIEAVAGGGGGAAYEVGGGAGQTAPTGGDGGSASVGLGITGGAGGVDGAPGQGSYDGGGGGFTGGAGFGYSSRGQAGAVSGTSFAGGAARPGIAGAGGFGGGGGGGVSNGGGGGGGYGGGGGGAASFGYGGGGGSYFNGTASVAQSGVADPASDGNGEVILTLEEAACYRAGTRILTERGEVAVEALRPGDRVLMARRGGPASREVLWLGHRRIDVTRHPRPREVWPVLVRRGAFGNGLPARDLYLSPNHAVFIEKVLVQIKSLINGVTVLQSPCPQVEYWHVELDSHDILLAEGLPVESYLDTGNRCAFSNGGAFQELHPDFAPKHWAEACVPLVLDGPEIGAAKARLLAHAAMHGAATTKESGLHIIADGERIGAVSLGGNRACFVLPAGCADITLSSRSFIPAHLMAHSRDERALGICVNRLQIDGTEIPLDAANGFAAGWHRLEQDEAGGEWRWRWTTGATPLPPHARLVVLDFTPGTYWAEQPAMPEAVEAHKAA